ncbi:GNAT family N-acetyltransferase [Caproiciproducens faecalis]|uniref:GNAT family N-acetyltransferase n=1 Tax=Caproiciproducens faecalis TaxID=2820301 RepID=A0ABS7DNL7_9FIRM|nr:GNAT family N-acetyltransferase [Caproiciproducens faecalis]MBW7572899.1 GNAT family N-acetyltransferase [Caproiciproducens faecalis]
MILEEKKVKLRNGEGCILRSPGAKDAAAVLEELRVTSGETVFMARYEDEITLTEEDERDFLDSHWSDPKSLLIAAEVNGEIVATAGISPSAPFERCRHRAAFGISVKEKYWGIGIASAILPEIIACAKEAGYEQLELEVVATNERAIALYQKFGFHTYGTMEKSFRYRDGSYGAQLLMLKSL